MCAKQRAAGPGNIPAGQMKTFCLSGVFWLKIKTVLALGISHGDQGEQYGVCLKLDPQHEAFKCLMSLVNACNGLTSAP